MKPRLMTPGPTPVPEETLLELAKPVGYHRSSEAKAILAEVSEDLKYVFQTKNPVVTLTSSGTGGMEAAVSNCFSAGEKVILLIAGRWGDRWRNLAKAFGLNAVVVEVPYGKAIQPAQLEEALKAHPDAVGVFATLSETSTGVGHDIAAFGKLVTATPAILVVDAISGLGCMECRTDEWNIDVNVTGSQKALMLPPGLAYVSISDKAKARIDANQSSKTFYFDLKKYLSKIAESDTPFTPANTLIKAQRVSLQRIRKEGIENLWARHARMARAARAGVQAMGLHLFAEQPNNGLTVITVPEGVDGNAVLSKIEKQYGIKLANGQDNMKGKIWRMAHMGYLDLFDVLAALSALELVLHEVGFLKEVGPGVAAAQQALAAKA
ncbi:pyridoxal-phosphate-dependent aminotransferase family protein [Tuwongella immobilis]|uniref:Aminotransferase class V domain-containing protein n=1 Tax=Tuwongella immobilis TaxID=692036 RepID=A0A6C2YRI4_9BACT|nr:alanine--glyoxylate aminotransferase family protein [Tuwongella immobilis]VIP03595.1 class v aminotransferase : Serine-pyruvate aminotransferase/archaeal aspartate aminotransferase OS=Singulisphaera acidiphila (strain ATCC BAA-1392 / DSM 18658 / VKM B-2454 / MOB10) GN=Sinac_6244 PE=3 SV=1: Aminotran_5 [Tuwongella immobilis]VTS04558.1 class v aminotransferase : Serine-pyruvate aminotransferase/archaeal aspartate aminotransferase OS=Singulisphaera acidiphila (strain ATCC BAA-1392 / DSM 18658 / V